MGNSTLAKGAAGSGTPRIMHETQKLGGPREQIAHIKLISQSKMLYIVKARIVCSVKMLIQERSTF